MELEQRFKRTELGAIPVDWTTASAAELVDAEAPICYGVVQVGRDTGGGVPIIAIKHVDNIKRARLHRSAAETERPYKRSRVREGDVLISIKGTIGRVGVVPQGFNGNISRELARLRPGSKCVTEFIAQQFQSAATQARIVRSVVGTTRQEFSIAALRDFRIALPGSLAEQHEIARVLGDVDALIGGLTQVAIKKRGIRRAAMQQLLTGNVRLPGFSGEWKRRTLRTLIQHIWPKSALSSGNGSDSGPYPLYVSGGVPKRIHVAQFKNADVLCFADGGVFSVRRATGDFSVTDHCYVVSLNTTMADNYWYAAWLTLNAERLDRMTFKGSGLRNLDKRALLSVELPYPTPEEQIAIATVLSDMDAELAALEARLEKTKALKQAMMQELLTGRTRLLAPEPAHA